MWRTETFRWSPGFDSLPAKVSHRPEASLACGCSTLAATQQRPHLIARGATIMQVSLSGSSGRDHAAEPQVIRTRVDFPLAARSHHVS
jgi:hypothetical protein